MSTFRLNCLVHGDTTKDAFPVDISDRMTVGDLKKKIKFEKQPEFDQFAPNKLDLWKVQIPLRAVDDPILKALRDNPQANIKDVFKGVKLSDPTYEVGEHWREPPKFHIHVIVEPPSAFPSHIPVKRELEFTLEPSKRLKTAFPVDSVSDFKELRDKNFFYVDKTKYIKEIENDRSVLMFLRPKRFGKSLLLSTIQHFYDVNEAQNFDRLFGPLEIYQHASELRHNQFLIFKWNLSRIAWSSSIEETNRNLRGHVNASIEVFCRNYAHILGKRSEELGQSIIHLEDCLYSLERLFLHFNACPYKIYLLIDEYDAITNEYLDPADTVSYQQIRDKQSVLKAIFGAIKDHRGKEIERVFMTGVSPLAMNDVTSGFNIRYDITLEPTYEHMCGLKKEDIRRALESIFTGREELTDEEKKISVDAHLERMREYYNGYKFRTTKDDGIYNTNLCLDYLQRLSMGDPLQLVDPNNELSESVLMFTGRHPDSTLLLTELLVTKQIPFEAIRQNIRLPDLVNVDSQGVDFLKSFLLYFGALTFTDQPGLFRLPNTVVTKTIIEGVLQLCNIQTGSDAFRNAVNQLITDDNVDFLCSYLEPRLKEWIKLGDLYDDRELVTKAVFQVSLSTIPRYLNDTEVPVKIYGNKTGYLDLLFAETKPASAGARPKRFVFEFKSKGVNFLALPNQGKKGWEELEAKAAVVEAMSTDEVLKLKCGNNEKYEQGKTMQAIFDAAAGQLKNYVQGLERDQGQFDTLAFVVLTVGSRKFIWRRVNI